MTAGMKALYSAAAALAAFRPGALEIDDDTLSVNAGGTVNLRARLTERPRSDVTVALAETSALISLGDASLIFTPDNWEEYQSVAVTGVGNRQEIALSGWNGQLTGVGGISGRGYIPSPRPSIASALLPSGNSATIISLIVASNGRLGLDPDGSDLSDAWEQNGSLAVTVGASTWIFPIAGADTSEPYLWTPANAATDGVAFYNAIAASIAATLTLRDYVPGDAAIALTASGTPEYEGETGSATVTVN